MLRRKWHVDLKILASLASAHAAHRCVTPGHETHLTAIVRILGRRGGASGLFDPQFGHPRFGRHARSRYLKCTAPNSRRDTPRSTATWCASARTIGSYSRRPEGGPLDYHNWRVRVELLKRTAHEGRGEARGVHQLRHAYAMALIQADENAKTVQTLLGHHSVAFTMDVCADAWPEQVANAGETAVRLLFLQVVAKRWQRVACSAE
jgi:hypothetical protein